MFISRAFPTGEIYTRVLWCKVHQRSLQSKVQVDLIIDSDFSHLLSLPIQQLYAARQIVLSLRGRSTAGSWDVEGQPAAQ